MVAALVSCNDNEKDVANNQSLSVTTNKEYVIEKGVFLNVREISDTRKPIGSKSNWKGEAKIKIQLYTGKRSVDTAISTRFPNEIVLDGYHLKLNSVYPYPELNKTRHQSDYVIQLSVENKK